MSRKRKTEDEVAKGKALGLVLQKARGRTRTADLADMAGVSVDTLRKLEQGRVADPGFFLVSAVAQALRLPLDAVASRTKRQNR